ncbi:Dabb family protein [Pedobacter sp. SYP-B3415]|uniref:Dabb family protein n=1 Tax=Pedobacter sp. SYP-B3415 TaxID=2496641 RepID=UPI00101DD5E9|nr:Dabb family protein [Pedobacter sp. SYP-B3415]
MIAHHVLFWLKPETTDAEKAEFKRGLETLENIEVVRQFHIGSPAPIERAVVDTTYTFSLILFFDDLAAHDIYQVHPVHKTFLENFRVFFERVVIYDAQ